MDLVRISVIMGDTHLLKRGHFLFQVRGIYWPPQQPPPQVAVVAVSVRRSTSTPRPPHTYSPSGCTSSPPATPSTHTVSRERARVATSYVLQS